MEIGYPTNVKHVAHIGWEGSNGTAPSWVCVSVPYMFNYCFLLSSCLQLCFCTWLWKSYWILFWSKNLQVMFRVCWIMQMNDFKTGSDVALASIGSAGSSRDPTWTSQGMHLSSHPSSHWPLSSIAYLLLHIHLDNLGTSHHAKNKWDSLKSSWSLILESHLYPFLSLRCKKRFIDECSASCSTYFCLVLMYMDASFCCDLSSS